MKVQLYIIIGAAVVIGTFAGLRLYEVRTRPDKNISTLEKRTFLDKIGADTPIQDTTELELDSYVVNRLQYFNKPERSDEPFFGRDDPAIDVYLSRISRHSGRFGPIPTRQHVKALTLERAREYIDAYTNKIPLNQAPLTKTLKPSRSREHESI